MKRAAILLACLAGCASPAIDPPRDPIPLSADVTAPAAKPVAIAAFLASLKPMDKADRRAALLAAVTSHQFPGDDGRLINGTLLAEYANDPDIHMAIATWRLAEGDPAGALAAAKRASALDPKRGAAWFLQGRVLILQRSYASAEPPILKAVALEPGNARYLNGLGALNALRGARDRALAAYRMAIDADSADGFAWYNSGVLYLGANRPRDAADAFYGAGLAYLKTGDTARAEDAARQLEALSRQGVRCDADIAILRNALTQSSAARSPS